MWRLDVLADGVGVPKQRSVVSKRAMRLGQRCAASSE